MYNTFTVRHSKTLLFIIRNLSLVWRHKFQSQNSFYQISVTFLYQVQFYYKKTKRKVKQNKIKATKIFAAIFNKKKNLIFYVFQWLCDQNLKKKLFGFDFGLWWYHGRATHAMT